MGEIAFENWFCDQMTKRGWLNRKMAYLGRRGCPDRFFFKGGKLLMIEFKAPGGRLSAGQRREHERMKLLGFTVHVVWDRLQADNFLAGLDAE